ncbi:TetR/AcrR family transcriptional regulator [Catenuloplanes japonicus]|uniref:TetR/AcrR family transcriptional regulator n=1 Tax=Catenuloplanes japonicus TaxID=33876 RepID=UPI000524FB6C|nr:TetR/AcrR family transcriptional regulator [Catenuloplanes japonicus]
MGRWEPNAPDRLTRAALELFLANGYENSTAAGIAERAGLGKSTFFRHFADKREVLFTGEELLHELATAAIDGAPAEASPLDVLDTVFDAFGQVFDEGRRPWARERHAVIQSATELMERELLKNAALTGALAEALRKRGVPDPAAGTAAELGNLAFRTGFLRWIAPGERRDFSTLAHEDLRAIRAALPGL